MEGESQGKGRDEERDGEEEEGDKAADTLNREVAVCAI